MKKLKVLWICHFSNSEVRALLPLSTMKFHNFIRSLAGKKKYNFIDFAPWITNLIMEFKKFQDIELHVISPFKGLRYSSYEFKLKGVSYYFYQPNIPLVHFPFPKIIKGYSKISFLYAKLYVKNVVKRISPDIINLIGTENPYYSAAILGIKNIPVYVSVQTVYTNPDRKIYGNNCLKLNWDVELKIHKQENYYGCSGRMHRDLILNNNPSAHIFKNFFPVQTPVKLHEVPKEYDFVFFASLVTIKKGIEDAIDALALVKKEKSNVTLNVVGFCKPDLRSSLNRKINALDLSENISFTDYFPVHSDMHQHIKKARFALLPVKLDVIPSSILEAILLGLPVVTYKTTGTPYLNKDGETVLISDIGDIQKLVENMLKLLNSPSLAEKLRKDAKVFVKKEFDNTVSARRLVDNYKAVINHYHHNTPIPQDLLFNPGEFPI